MNILKNLKTNDILSFKISNNIKAKENTLIELVIKAENNCKYIIEELEKLATLKIVYISDNMSEGILNRKAQLNNNKNKRYENADIQTIVIFTDGAATGNGTNNCCAGWGVFIPSAPFCFADGEKFNKIGFFKNVKLCGKVEDCIDNNGNVQIPTNNRAELAAIYAALTWAQYTFFNTNININLLIVSDSKYCIGTITEWAPQWVRDNTLQTKKNPDLVEELLYLMNMLKTKFEISFLHMRGHGKEKNVCNEYIICNEIADAMANSGLNCYIVPKEIREKLIIMENEENYYELSILAQNLLHQIKTTDAQIEKGDNCLMITLSNKNITIFLTHIIYLNVKTELIGNIDEKIKKIIEVLFG